MDPRAIESRPNAIRSNFRTYPQPIPSDRQKGLEEERTDPEFMDKIEAGLILLIRYAHYERV